MIMKEMKQMPYKIEEGAIERAKYRAKMAVREAAHPTERPSHKVHWRWASAVAAVVTVVAVAVVWFVKPGNDAAVAQKSPMTPMESLVAQMNNVSDDILNDLAVDAGYYLEEENQL